MSETTGRATGATDEQIEAAVERHWQEILEERPDATRTPTYTYEIEREIAGIACYLVPPGYRIVPADAVLSEAEREALRERIAKAIHAHDESIGEVPSSWSSEWNEIPGGDRDVYRSRADAILALPELRALAAGKPLWVECETCGGTCYAPNLRDDCPACGGVGFVPVP